MPCCPFDINAVPFVPSERVLNLWCLQSDVEIINEANRLLAELENRALYNRWGLQPDVEIINEANRLLAELENGDLYD
jgi:hypothetical protein